MLTMMLVKKELGYFGITSLLKACSLACLLKNIVYLLFEVQLAIALCAFSLVHWLCRAYISWCAYAAISSAIKKKIFWSSSSQKLDRVLPKDLERSWVLPKDLQRSWKLGLAKRPRSWKLGSCQKTLKKLEGMAAASSSAPMVHVVGISTWSAVLGKGLPKDHQAAISSSKPMPCRIWQTNWSMLWEKARNSLGQPKGQRHFHLVTSWGLMA